MDAAPAMHPEGERQTPWLLWARSAIGLVGGVGLLALWRASKADLIEGPLLAALGMVGALLPFVLLAGLGAMRPLALAVWAAIVAVALFGLGWRDPNGSHPVLALTPLALFIAHHLVQTALAAGRWRAPYPAYFELGWRHGVQLALTGAFTGGMWVLLGLAAALFDMLGVDLVHKLITKDYFAFPVTGLAIAAAVHLTMERAALVTGARTLALTLFSWLLPLLTLIAAAFLATAPFRGIEAVWKGDFGSGLLAWAAVLLIFLINATYQAGDRPKSSLLALGARLAAVLLTPLVVLALIGVWLRVGQHGLTPARVFALAGFVILAAYAAAYAFAALSRRGWLAPLGAGNVVCAGISVLVQLALLSPLADPTRLAIASQVARLERGQVDPDSFDYNFLAQSGARGKAALEKLAARTGDARAMIIAARAKAAIESKDPALPSTVDLRQRIVLVGVAPADVPAGLYKSELTYNNGLTQSCRLVACAFRRANVAGETEWLGMVGGDVYILQPSDPNNLQRPWRAVASSCCINLESFREGAVAPAPPERYPDTLIGETRLKWRVNEAAE